MPRCLGTKTLSLGSQVRVSTGTSLRCWGPVAPGPGTPVGLAAPGVGCRVSLGPPAPTLLPHHSQALLLLGAAALACLALDLIFLLFYSFWLCCRGRKSEEHLDADCCCTAWCVIIATLVCR